MANLATPIYHQVVSTYSYSNGAGSAPNRKIYFVREGAKPSAILASVVAIVGGKEHEISLLGGDEINVEMMSTTEKMQALMASRSGNSFSTTQYAVPDKKLCELSVEEQDEILLSFTPKGTWKVEITNGFGQDPRFEKVVNLNLFNPA